MVNVLCAEREKVTRMRWCLVVCHLASFALTCSMQHTHLSGCATFCHRCSLSLFSLSYTHRVEELYGGMQAASQAATPTGPVRLEPSLAEQIYTGGEQCLAEGLY